MSSIFKLLFVGLKSSKGVIITSILLLVTIAFNGCQFSHGRTQKSLIKTLESTIKENKKLWDAEVSQLKSENFDKDLVIMACDESAKQYITAAEEADDRATAEKHRRELLSLALTKEKAANEKQQQIIFKRLHCDGAVIDDDTSSMFDKKLSDVQAAGSGDDTN